MKGKRSLSLAVRLALSYLAIILIGMGSLAPLAWVAVERLYLDTQRENLLAQAKMVAATLGSAELTTYNPGNYSQASNVNPGIHIRVIDTQGAIVIALTGTGPDVMPGGLVMPVMAQNAAGVVTPDELINRPEILQARLGEPATAIRRVEAAGGRRVLYAAAPVVRSDGEGQVAVSQIVYLATPLPDTQWSALPTRERWLFVGVILGATCLASGIGLLLARQIARPMERLVDAAHAVAAGNLNQAVPEEQAITELAILGQAFNKMTNSLRQADQAKTAFISDVSHELRTPLTVIKGTIETLQDGALDDLDARGPFLASMNRETERLIRLVNDLLVLTRADAGVLNLHKEPLDLDELVRERCEMMQQAATQRQVSFNVITEYQLGREIPEPARYRVLADADRMAQVLDNLLDNALRYSPPGREVKVTLQREGEEVSCQVTDEGPGISAQHLPYIFERFYRADPARDRSQGGSGLGLAIVRGLVQAHGGRVNANSSPGQGTTVTFWLPASGD